MKNLTHSKFIRTLLTVIVVLSAAVPGMRSSSAAPTSPGKLSMPGPQLILLHDDRYIPHHVPPPARAKLGIQTATFSVNWNPATCSGTVTPWSSEAQAAFQYAVNIWSSLLNSSQTIVVDACWRSDLSPGVLGSAGAEDFYRNFTNAPTADTWYPIALANSLAGSDLNESTAEIGANFSSTFDWYYGTDGNTPGSQVDFVSVVLHELGHGLGFAGSMLVDDGVSGNGTECNNTAGMGCWGYGSGYPFAYDRFTEDGAATPLLNYTNSSAALGNALTGQVGGGVYFDGPNANVANTDYGQTPVKLYTPSSWQQGSSYSHLDEIFNGTAHALMTYSLGNGESEHNPGTVTLGMFQDTGWTTASQDPAPTVTSITPNSGENTGTVSITNLAGSNFQDEATVKLTKSGQTDINATGVTVASDSQITCNFDLTGAAAGQWNVVVTNPDAQSGTLTNGFTVTAPPAPDVSISQQVTGSDFAPGDSITFILTIANDGNKTASSVVVTDDLPDEVLDPSFVSTLDITPTGAFSYTWDVEPLNEGDNGTITISGLIDPNLEDDFSFANVATISDPEDNTPNNNTDRASVGTFRIYLPLVMRNYPPLPDTPVLNVISNSDGDGNYTVSWNAADGADTYILEEDNNASFSSPTTDSPTSSTYKSITGQADGTYYYRVKARNSWGDSGWSTTRSVTVSPPPPPTTIYPSGDAVVLQGAASTNFGGYADMWAGYDHCSGVNITRSLVKFDVSSIPAGTSITQATLYLYLYNSCDSSNRSHTVTAYRTNGNWSESSVTWNNKPGYAEARGSTSIQSRSPGWYSMNVTDLMRGWVNGSFTNHGLTLRGPEGSGNSSAMLMFYTRESSTHDPYLSIQYAGMTTFEETLPAVEGISTLTECGPMLKDALGISPDSSNYDVFGLVEQATCSLD